MPGTKKPSEKQLDLDFILKEVGTFGRYQIKVFVFLIIAIIFSSIANCQYIFTAAPVLYRCKVPECESSPPIFTPGDWSKFALPADKESACWRNKPVGTACEPGSFSKQIQPCHSWVYENSETIVTEYDLACQEWKRTLVGTTHNVGVFFAIPLTAVLSDKFGRKLMLILTSVLPGIVGVARAFCNYYILYLVLEFLEALIGNGTYATAFIIGLEIVGLKKRVIGGNILAISFAMGQVVAASVSWLLPYWRSYTLAIFAPTFGFVIYFWFDLESVRWLICKGKTEEAIRIILKIARTNRVKLLPHTMKYLSDALEKKEGPSQPQLPHEQLRKVDELGRKPKPSLFLQVIRSKTILFRLCVCSFWWVTVTMVYYGLSINSISLGGNKYITYILTALMDIPGGLLSIVTLDRFGRKGSIMTCFFVCGISLLVMPTVNNTAGVIALNLIGKMMISLIFCATYIYTVELFPTEARHRLMGFCSMTGRIGSMSAPQTPLLMKYMKSLPYLLFGTMAGVAGLLMLFTPETLHMKLPDTIADAEKMTVAMCARTRKRTNMIV